MKYKAKTWPGLSPGMTLIEVMIVVAMIGGIMTLGALVLFPGDEAKLQDEAMRLAGTIKYTYNEAAIKNRYYRLAFDLENNTYKVEYSTEPFYVSMKEEEELPGPKPEKGSGAEEEGEFNEEAGAPPAFSEVSGLMLKPVKLARGVKIKDVTVLHAPERQEMGIVHAYFLPNGWAEPMIVNLSDDDEETFYSLEVNPLTGKAAIRPAYFETGPDTFVTQEAL